MDPSTVPHFRAPGRVGPTAGEASWAGGATGAAAGASAGTPHKESRSTAQQQEQQAVFIMLPDGSLALYDEATDITVADILREHPGHLLGPTPGFRLGQQLPLSKRLKRGATYFLRVQGLSVSLPQADVLSPPLRSPGLIGSTPRALFRHRSSSLAHLVSPDSPTPQAIRSSTSTRICHNCQRSPMQCACESASSRDVMPMPMWALHAHMAHTKGTPHALASANPQCFANCVTNAPLQALVDESTGLSSPIDGCKAPTVVELKKSRSVHQQELHHVRGFPHPSRRVYEISDSVRPVGLSPRGLASAFSPSKNQLLGQKFQNCVRRLSRWSSVSEKDLTC